MNLRLKYWLAEKPTLLALLYGLKLKWTRRTNNDVPLFCRLLRCGDVAFDVGANQGDYSVIFSRIVGWRGQVHAFEPIPKTADRLDENVLRYTRHQNTIVNRFGLSDKESELQFFLPMGESQLAASVRHSDDRWVKAATETLECRVMKADDYVLSHRVARLDFFKCDTEGAEMLVLRGSVEILERLRPILFLESFRRWTTSFGYNPSELLDFLIRFGYNTFFVSEKGLLRQISTDFEALDSADRAEPVNIIAGIRAIHGKRLDGLTVSSS